MTRRSAFAPILGAAILGTAVVLAAWPEAPPDPAAPAPKLRPVRVAEVSPSAQSRTVRLAGLTRAVERADIAFAVPARLASRPVETGDRVARGQLLASLDDREYRLAEQAASAALSEIEVRLAQARRDLERVQRLADARAATGEEVEQAQAATAALAAARDAAAARLDDTRRLRAEATLRAPFDGTVTAVHAEPGEWIGPGQPVVELSGRDDLEVLVEAPETLLTRLSVGQRVTVNLPLAGLEVAGRISGITAATSGPGRLFPVEVMLEPDDRLVPGLAAEALLPIDSTVALTVPIGAVVNPGSSHPTVFRIRDGHATRVTVELGQVVGDRVAVSGDLDAG
jgi:RND family efflux transporter MFP subunit